MWLKISTVIKNFFCVITFRPYRYIVVDFEPHTLAVLQQECTKRKISLSTLVTEILTEQLKRDQEKLAKRPKRTTRKLKKSGTDKSPLTSA